jgi:hypothetical protein
MKRLFLILLLIAFASSNLRASVTFAIDAGQLRGYASGVPQGMPVLSSTDGGLLLLIANTGENSFLSAGVNQYVTGDDSILAAFAMNDNGGTNEVTAMLGPLTYGGAVAAGDEVALRWFPGITLSQYDEGLLPGLGQYYGTYSAGNSIPDGGSPWFIPADTGATLDLQFYTTDNGGTQSPIQGYADSEIELTAGVPEPATASYLTGALALCGWMISRRKR